MSFEAEILASPDAPAAWAVYGDFLASQGDPRGELVAIQQARARASGAEFARLVAVEDAFLAKHAKHFYGPIARAPKARQTSLDWENGFVEAIDGLMLSEADAFLAHPSARFVRRARRVSVRELPPLLHSLSTFEQNPSAVLAHEPLRELELDSSAPLLPAMRHPLLERLAIRHASSAALQALGQALLPRLKELVLEHVSNARDVVTAVERLEPPDLHLQLENVDDVTALAPIVDRITTLGAHGPQALFASMASYAFASAKKLIVTSSESVATVFDAFPSLPALEEVSLSFPSDSVRFFRGFNHSLLARRVKKLGVRVVKPAAGHALVEHPYEALEHLELTFDELSAEFLESAKMLAVDAFPNVRSLSLAPSRHIPALAASPMAARLTKLRLAIHGDADVSLWTKHRERFVALDTLVVHGDRRLSAPSLTALCTSAPNVIWEPRVCAE